MRQLGIDLREDAPEILRLWKEVVAAAPCQLPTTWECGELPAIIYDLIEVSLLRPHDLTAHEQKVAAAVRHGESRRRDGSKEAILYQEFAALREAVRRHLLTRALPPRELREALIRFDMAITVTELAAVRGFHRAALEKAGLWDTLVCKLARQSPLLAVPEPEQVDLT